MATLREVAAFKAGTWAGMPIEYALEHYAYPYAKKRFKQSLESGTLAPYYQQYVTGKRRRLSAHKAAGSASYVKHKRSSSVYSPAYKMAYRIGAPERKVHTTQLNSGALTTHNTQDALMFNMNQGVEAGQRIAKEIYAQKLSINMFARNIGNANDIYLRVLVLTDKKPQLGTTNTNLFRSKGEAYEPIDFGATATMDSIRNPINYDRFTVHSDRRFHLAANLPANSGHQDAVIKYTVNINRKIKYLADTVITSSDKITPNLWIKYWIERDDSAAIASQANVSMDIYQHFKG